ncbi:hypothetical protein AWB75_06294 [Caballeronia catudaia]|uniref:Transmembrane protein n=1 Tax=Caballeronia catudaia TaxID=1777136 RepID=A0A158D6X9_9BURK|nr:MULTISPECIES: hypothetical protein [Caballeronia]SAK90271.1 hypothetical protein AWB75_06294 [Caballeronia catudaia]
MQDFAFLFSDSVSAWLRGRGDGRFQRYERHYRSDRASAPSPDAFDLEKSNVLFSRRSRRGKGRIASVLKSKPFAALATFLIFLWGGSLLLSTIGTSQPVTAGVALCVAFVVLRASKLRKRAQR